MSSQYPQNIDTFQIKHDAISQDDTNGDYVMADDFNHLQDAITAIETTMGINPASSASTVSERLSKIDASASQLRVSPILVYFGNPSAINGAPSIDEAVKEYLRYDHVIFGSGLDNTANANHANTILIIQKAKAIHSDIKFYGYIDPSILSVTTSQLQISINNWKTMGVDGIYCDKFSYDFAVTRTRQNLVLDSIHQNNIVAIVNANNPDQILGSVTDATYNPNGTVSHIQTGDIYFFEQFGIVATNTPYVDVNAMFTKINKVYPYRLSTGIKIFGTASIADNVAHLTAQSYFDYAHALAILCSLDGFYSVSENNAFVSNTSIFYDSVPVPGRWYITNPIIIHTSSNTIHTRACTFGNVIINSSTNTFQYTNGLIPTYMLRPIANTFDGLAMKDASIADSKITSYDASRLISSINGSTDKININNIQGLVDSGGNISEGLITGNVILAINANIGAATIAAAKISDLDATKITTGSLAAGRISASVVAAINLYAATIQVGDATIANAAVGTLSVDNMKANIIDAVNISTQDISADRIKANVIAAVNISADDIASDRMRANVVSAINIYSDTITVESAKIKSAAVGILSADRISASVIDAVNANIGSAVISSAKIGVLTADHINAAVISAINTSTETATIGAAKIGVLTASNIGSKIAAGVIDSSHITTGGLDAQLVTVYNSATGQTLMGAGYLNIDGLDAGVVQSDNLAANGVFLTASSQYGLLRDNVQGEVIVGTNSVVSGGHEVWKVDIATGAKLASIPIAGKKPYSIAISDEANLAYVTVQGDDTIVQIDLVNNVVNTSKTLQATMGPGIIKYVGEATADHKHLFTLGTDEDDMHIPDTFMVIDGPPQSVNASTYLHHVIPIGNNPVDFVLDETTERVYITMGIQGDVVILDHSNSKSLYWKLIGRIPITAYSTDIYHGGLPGDYGLGVATGGSSYASYQTTSMAAMPGMHMHDSGGYSGASGDLKTYEPRGIALSSNTSHIYVVDRMNNQLVIIDTTGNAPYNSITGTRETAHAGTGSTSPATDGTRDYTNTIGQTRYVRYRIDIGTSPEFVQVVNGKVFVTLSGDNQLAVIDEMDILDAITADIAFYATWDVTMPMNPLPMFMVRTINVGSKPMMMHNNGTTLYVVLNGQNQIAKVDTMAEVVSSYINTGANPTDLAITSDGSTMYIVNHGGIGSLSFVYPMGSYIGDAYLGLEGMVNHQGADQWMPNRSNWTYDGSSNLQSSSTIEFRINEPLMNEGGYVKISATGKDVQWAKIEQDIINVTNHSDGSSPAGRWFKNYNGSLLATVGNGTSANFISQFEIDEFVPKFIYIDNQQTVPFTPTADGVTTQYTGLEYSTITNRAISILATASATPTSGSLSVVTDNDFTEVIEGNVLTTNTATAPYVTLPSGLQYVTIDLGKIYMVGSVNPCHMYNVDRIYHGTKTQVSEDNIIWTTIYDSAVSGEYPERFYHSDHGHTHYGKIINLSAQRVRYVRDYCNGWTSIDGLTSGTENTWAEVRVYGDWEYITNYVYPPLSQKTGQVATNGTGFVSTDITNASIAYNFPIEFTSWQWMTFIGGPQFGTMQISVPSMGHVHFLSQEWGYVTNLPHKHAMLFTPSLNIKADMNQSIVAGQHRIVLSCHSGTVTLDRIKIEDFQFYVSSPLTISSVAAAAFQRYKIVSSQSQSYVGTGRQSTESAYDDLRKNPDTGLADGSVPLRYRLRLKAQLNPQSGNTEQGILYATSFIFEQGKLSSHWRMSQSSDLIPSTKLAPFDAMQPHNTGIQSQHLAFGSVNGNIILPGAVVNHHISNYAKIAEYKLDLNYPTHGHTNKAVLDLITGLGTSGVSSIISRDDHTHTGMLVVGGTPANNMIPIWSTGSATWGQLNIPVANLTDITTYYYDKTQVDAKISAVTGGGSSVYGNTANTWTDTNTFTKSGMAILIQPATVPTANTVLMQILNQGGTNLLSIDYEGDIVSSGNLTLTGTGSITGVLTLGTQATTAAHAVRADRILTAGTGLTGGGDLTADRSFAVNFAGTGVASTVAHSDHTHSGFVSTGTSQSTGDGFTVTGAQYIGGATSVGMLYLRNNSTNVVIQLDAASGTMDANAQSYIAGNGNATFKGTVTISTLVTPSTSLVVNLNAEKINSVKEADLAKVSSILEIAGSGVQTGLKVQARGTPSQTSVWVTTGVVYDTSGHRISIAGFSQGVTSVNTPTYSQIDIIYITGASAGTLEGTVAVVSGTAAVTPVAPTVPADGIPLAQILNRYAAAVTDGFNRGTDGGVGTADGSFNSITDARVYKPILWDGTTLSLPSVIAPTVTLTDNSTKVATTAFVKGQNYGTVTSVTSSNTDMSFTNTTITPVGTINTGMGSNQIVKLDSNARVSADILTDGNTNGYLSFSSKVKFLINPTTGYLEVWGI
jgi:hypothetical protein